MNYSKSFAEKKDGLHIAEYYTLFDFTIVLSELVENLLSENDIRLQYP